MDLLRKNDFELFSIPQQFALDEAAVTAAFLKLQLITHPDRFASATDAEKRVSLQLTTRVNEAYQRLKSPLDRASYLCELNGAPINAHTNTAMPSDFLIKQMRWREALDESDVDLIELHREVVQSKADLLTAIAQQLDSQRNFDSAASNIRQLMFVEKFLQSLSSAMH
jgi:molecular chaperone HscB